MQQPVDRDAVIPQATSASLHAHHVVRVLSRPGVDRVGEEALRVTIVLSGQDEVSSGEEALNTISGIHLALQSVGDDRFPFVDFMNEHDLASHAGPESDSFS